VKGDLYRIEDSSRKNTKEGKKGRGDSLLRGEGAGICQVLNQPLNFQTRQSGGLVCCQQKTRKSGAGLRQIQQRKRRPGRGAFNHDIQTQRKKTERKPKSVYRRVRWRGSIESVNIELERQGGRTCGKTTESDKSILGRMDEELRRACPSAGLRTGGRRGKRTCSPLTETKYGLGKLKHACAALSRNHSSLKEGRLRTGRLARV